MITTTTNNFEDKRQCNEIVLDIDVDVVSPSGRSV